MRFPKICSNSSKFVNFCKYFLKNPKVFQKIADICNVRNSVLLERDIMAIKEFLRRLSYEVKRRENVENFAKAEFYFPDEMEEVENLEVGETQVSVTAKIQS